MKKIPWILFFVAATLLITPVYISAQTTGGRIKFGNLSIVPSIGLSGVYDDNIYMGNGNTYAGDAAKTKAEQKVSDWITRVAPGLAVNLAFPERGSLSFGYIGDFAFYSSQTDNNWGNHQGFLNLDYTAPGGLILGINDRYTRAEDPYGSADQYKVGRTTKRSLNTLASKIGFRTAQNFRVLFLYNNTYQNYDNDQLDYSQDYYTHSFGLSLETQLLPKTWGFVRYLYAPQTYNQNAPGQTGEFNSDSKQHQVQTGLTWDLGAKWSGEVNVGYGWKKYDHEFTDALKTSRRTDENNWTAGTTVKYEMTSRTQFAFILTRTNRDNASDTAENFTDTNVGLTVQQALLPNLVLGGGFTYGINDYNLPRNNPRADKNYIANIGLNYQFRPWIGFGVSYIYNRKSSNYEENEFTDNKGMVTVNIAY